MSCCSHLDLSGSLILHGSEHWAGRPGPGFCPALLSPAWDESLFQSGPGSHCLGQGTVGENVPQDTSCLRPRLSPLWGSSLTSQVREMLAG